MLLPIPEDAPVMTMVLPLRRFAIADAIAFLTEFCWMRKLQEVRKFNDGRLSVGKTGKRRHESIRSKYAGSVF